LENISHGLLLDSNKSSTGENVVFIEPRHLHKILSRALGKELITFSNIVEEFMFTAVRDAIPQLLW
jgi:hypothetical protein